MIYIFNIFLCLFFIILANSCKTDSNLNHTNLYPDSSIAIKYQLDWQKKFYKDKIQEFKNSPIGYNKIVFLGNSITQGLRLHQKHLNRKIFQKFQRFKTKRYSCLCYFQYPQVLV